MLGPVAGVCALALKTEGDCKGGEREADKLGMCVEGWFLVTHLIFITVP